MTLAQLENKWRSNANKYAEAEIGSGVQEFVKDIFTSPYLLRLTSTPRKTGKFLTFVHDTEAGERGRPDFVIYAANDVTIPVEVKCFGRIKEGVPQLFRYQLDYSKQYGILTDGNEWRFYRAGQHSKFYLSEILEKTQEFLTFWSDYIKPEHYYSGIFNPKGQLQLFDEKLDLNDSENRKIFFDDTTNLIHKFMVKMRARGTFADYDDKKALEVSYSYLIQFILFKVIVDNGFKSFTDWYKNLFKVISKFIYDTENYSAILNNIKVIADYVSTQIYKPFAKEQENINNKIFGNLRANLIIDDISPWLDNLIFIDKYIFGNLKNEIFGFIYENYLKDLYGENKGQYFTDPDVVNVMLKEVGYTAQKLKNQQDKLSIIDPSCGAGTFLYSAVDAIIESFGSKFTKEDAQKIEKIVSQNIFGLDIEEFPLYLAEMSILMKLLPLIIGENFENPIEDKIKVFKTNDSISEFLDAGIGATNPDIDFPTLFSKNDLGYSSFLRDNQNLQEMIESMQGHNGERMRFDFVVGNPPYVSYNDCSRQNMPFINNIKDKNYESITFGNVYDVNMHSVPGRPKKYAPKPNLWAFFTALSLALLKNGGKMVYIIPQTLLTETDYDTLRYHLAKFTTIEKLITFGGKMFIGRGLKENKPVATSSLIFVVKKAEPEINHKTQIIQYEQYDKLPDKEKFKKYFTVKKNRQEKSILQKELLDNFDNWNFIKQNKNVVKFLTAYKQNSADLSIYYNHKLAKEHFNDIFYFDAGFTLDKSQYSSEYIENAYKLVYINSANYVLKTYNYYSKANSIIIPQGSQGLKCLDKKYKIVWRKTFAGKTKFNFCELSDIMLDTGLQFISSDNKNEILFLLALLNSKINTVIFDKLLKLAHEQKGIFIVIKRLKNFIRIPKITSENQAIKDKIIEKTEKMLDLEKVVLSDLVDFKNFTIQRFENIEVSGNQLVLTFNNKEYKLPIKENADYVKKLIAEKYYDNSLIFNRESVTLSELKNLEAIDFDEQQKLKNEIDELVFELYFGTENEELKRLLE